MHAQTHLNIGATPIALPATAREIGSVIAHNEHSATLAYLKVWRLLPAAPTVATDAPDFVLPLGAGVSQVALFAAIEPDSWIACTQEAGAGDTAPASTVNVTFTWGSSSG